MSDLDNQDEHKARIQDRVRNAKSELGNEKSELSDVDDQQDNKSSAAANLTWPRTLKKPGGKNEV